MLHAIGHSASGGLVAMHGSGPWWKTILPPHSQHPESQWPSVSVLCLQDYFLLGSVVSERVPQEDEDEDDAGGCQCGTGDVKQPCCLGILHSSIQVIQELLVPDLEADGGGREVEVRRGNKVEAIRETKR